MPDNYPLHLHHTVMTINDKIRTLRQSKGYTQDYIADKLGIDTVNYGRIERGQAKLTVDRLMKICEILEVAPAVLFGEKDENRNPNDELLNKIHKEIQSINNKLNTIL